VRGPTSQARLYEIIGHVMGTVIVDAYSADRAAEMADAIDWLCPPSTWGPFASSGLYGFWDPASRELLYIGLARDLGIRFRQHNGLAPCRTGGCKIAQVRRHFDESHLLGYTIYPQSPIDQPDSERARRPFRDDVEARAMLEELADPGHDELVLAEGQLIQAYLNRYGTLPPWNRIGGSADGASRATEHTEPLLDVFRARYRCPLNTRATLRELALDDEACRWENLLHVARFWLLVMGGEVSNELLHQEVERLAAGADWTGAPEFRELLASGYLDES